MSPVINKKGAIMSLVENELNLQNVELARNNPEFARRQESEKKLVPINPELFNQYKDMAIPIDQTYLSRVGEEFSLRVRKSPKGDGYTATLKDEGVIYKGMKKRLQVETSISQAAYEFYSQNPNFWPLKQLRAPMAENMTIDFIEGDSLMIIEPETDDMDELEALMASLEGMVEDRTDDPTLNKEYIAHRLAGTEKDIYSPESLEHFSHRLAAEMVSNYTAGRNQVVLGLTGMSGSGKTTVTKAIQEIITEAFGEQFKPIVVSTDDYHRGKKWLEATYGAPWTEWDDPRVYNTPELAFDLEKLAEGLPLLRRHFDFDKEETVFDEEVQPSPFVIVEGLYAGSKDLNDVRNLHYELPTGIATSIGRDVRRLVIEHRANRAFPTPESRLKYQIETALPLYLSQERPHRNNFNASMRTMAERAFMLEKLQSAS